MRPASSSSCQVTGRPRPPPGWPARRHRRRRRRTRRGRRPSRPSSASSAPGGRDVGQAEVDAHRVRPGRAGPGRRASRWCRAAPRRTGRRRPSQSTNVPDFSTAAATGSTTSARSVTATGRSSRLTTNRAASSAASAAVGSGRSCGSTPPTSSAPSSPECTAARIAAVSRPASVGKRAAHPRRSPRRRAPAASDTGRPPGSRPGSAPASTAPRSPARRGTHARPRLGLSASRTDGRQRARHGRQPLADQDDDAVPAQCGSRVRLTRSSRGPQGVEHAQARRRGRSGCTVAESLSRPRVAKGATAYTARPPSHRLAQPQEDDRRLLLGLEPDEQHRATPTPGRRR